MFIGKTKKKWPENETTLQSVWLPYITNYNHDFISTYYVQHLTLS